MAYYIPVVYIFILSVLLADWKYARFVQLLKIINLFSIGSLIYSFALGVYFHAYSSEISIDAYPSRIISSISSSLLYFVIIPLDLICLILYLVRKRKG